MFVVGGRAQADLAEGLVMYLGFDEAGGDTATDGSGNGNDGDFVSGPARVDGKYDGGVEFDGSNYIEVEHSDSFIIEDEITIADWIKPELAGSEWQGLITKGPDANEQFEVLINANGAFIHTAWQFANGRLNHNRGDFAPDVWQHFAVTYAPGAWDLYVDGEQVDTQANADSAMTVDPDPLLIGEELNMSRLFQGVMDEAVVYSRALSEDEINELMEGLAAALPVRPAGKVATAWGALKSTR